MSTNSKYQETKDRCLARGQLYEDPDFPAVPRSVYFSKVDPSIQWKRPTELHSNPKFVYESASRFDLDQGELGNCWYIAAAATLATRPELFKRVVPEGQHFGPEYVGLFRFNFWCYGTWIEVLVDDRLPTRRGRLVFCSNREHLDEFWPALLEKAYAKLVGSYEAMEGGWTEDALVDFTGGIGQRIDLTKNKPPEFFRFLLAVNNMSTLMGCAIHATPETMENELTNGLVVGHAYSITSIKQVMIKNKQEQLLRLRNPWGKKEWNGAWSDRSREWLSLDPKSRQELGIVIKDEGEFWMSFKDWSENFHQVQLCYLPPGVKVEDHVEWKEVSYHGSWVKGVNAGGSGHRTNQALYWTNSQYCVVLSGEADSHRSQSGGRTEKKNVVVISLMQKGARRARTTNRVQMADVAKAFDLYKAKSDKLPPTLTDVHYEKYALQIEKRGGQYQYYREISDFFNLEDGVYIIIPSTYEPHVEGDYLLRIYTDGVAESNEMDIQTEPLQMTKASTSTIEQLFQRYSGNDGIIDGRELQILLNEAFKHDLEKSHQFDLETCRCLISMLDRNRSGVLELDELRRIWTEVTTWRDVFLKFDRDESDFIESSELQQIFKSVGFNLSRHILQAIVRRYCGKECKLSFSDFVLVITKVATLVEIFPNLSRDGLQGKAELSLDKLLELVLYF